MLRKALQTSLWVQLYVQLFNKVNCWFVQAVKIGSLAAAISHAYSGIRFGQEHPFIGAFCVFICVTVFIAYCGTFHRAHRLSGEQKKFKMELKVACESCTAAPFRHQMRRAVKALRCPGLRVGTFHEMERNSALIYIGFVQSQLVNMLVAF